MEEEGREELMEWKRVEGEGREELMERKRVEGEGREELMEWKKKIIKRLAGPRSQASRRGYSVRHSAQ